jgi:hypothetical protein
MTREKLEKKPARNQYQLREGYSIKEGDVLVSGPDFITRSLEEAFKIKHMLEEAHTVEAQWKARQSERNATRRDSKLRAAAIARGLDPDEVMRNRPGNDGGGGD